MEINLINYTGIPLKIFYGESSETILGCNKIQKIEIKVSKSKLTRFWGKYISVETPIKAKGTINITLDSKTLEQNIVFGAFLDGKPKYITCIEINDSGKYLYTELSTDKLNTLYNNPMYYNLSLYKNTDNKNIFGRIKDSLDLAFSEHYCKNRDAPMCDKVVGMPIMLLLAIVLLILFGFIIFCFIDKLYINKFIK